MNYFLSRISLLSTTNSSVGEDVVESEVRRLIRLIKQINKINAIMQKNANICKCKLFCKSITSIVIHIFFYVSTHTIVHKKNELFEHYRLDSGRSQLKATKTGKVKSSETEGEVQQCDYLGQQLNKEDNRVHLYCNR